MKRSMNLVLLFVVMFMFSGCSVFMAAKQPGKKDMSLFNVGTPRSLVIAEFGVPIYTEEKDGNKVDIFKFVQGYSKGAKVGRAFFHGAADIWTLGLWEVVGTPTEMVADGKETKVEVKYDKENKIIESNVLGLKKDQ